MGGAGSSRNGVCPEESVTASSRTLPSAGSVTRTRAPGTGSGPSPAVTKICKSPLSR